MEVDSKEVTSGLMSTNIKSKAASKLVTASQDEMAGTMITNKVLYNSTKAIFDIVKDGNS